MSVPSDESFVILAKTIGWSNSSRRAALYVFDGVVLLCRRSWAFTCVTAMETFEDGNTDGSSVLPRCPASRSGHVRRWKSMFGFRPPVWSKGCLTLFSAII